MNAGSLPFAVMAARKRSATAGSGDCALNGMAKKRMPAALAAAASASMSAPDSVGSRRLMIDANPIFLISGTASAFVAPAQATVVSTRAKLVTPGTVSLVTFWAPTGAAHSDTAARTPTPTNVCDRIMESPFQKTPSYTAASVYFCSTVTVTGEVSLTVTGSPGWMVAA